VRAEFLHVEGQTDEQTDMTKLIVALRYVMHSLKQEEIS
jgi:hypothetical protein